MSVKARRVRAALSIVCLIGAGAGATPVLAQGAPSVAPEAQPPSSSNQIQDIIVTAQKREQSLSKVGISITALSGATLAQAGIKDSMQIVAQVPNMENSAIYGPGSSTNFSIRGVAQNDYNDGTESPIATYVDEIYMIPNGAGSFPLYDMERVEVLRGPQGTLFGRNSTGGLIHFITAKPTDHFEGMVSGEIGSYGTREITGMLNVPITDKLYVRVAGQYHYNNGWVKNITGNQPNSGQVETGSIRGEVKWKPTSNITDVLKVSYDRADGATYAPYHQAVGINAVTGDQFVLGPNQNFYGTGAQRDLFGQANISNRETDNGSHVGLLAKSTNVANHLDVDLGNITVTSVTGYNRYQRSQSEDCDGTQLALCQTHYLTNSHLITQEIRANGNFGDIKVTAGLFYMHQHLTLNDIAPLQLNTANPIAIYIQADQIAQSYAIFGNVEYDIGSKLKLIGGLRGSKDKKHFQQALNYNTPCDDNNPFPNYATSVPSSVPYCGTIASNIFTDATVGNLTKIDKNTWSMKAETDYTPSSLTLLYVSFSRGVKSPGFNNGIISLGLSPDQYQFKDETLLSYEAGVKTQFLNRHASFSASGFYYDYHNYDTLNYVGIGSFTDNHNAKLFGIEGELRLQPLHGLSINLSAGYTHSKLYDVANAGLVVADRQMPLAPSWTANGLVRYETNVSAIDQVFGFQVNAHARAAYYNDPGNDTAAKLPSIGLVDARIDLSNPNKDYTVAISAKNLFNKFYVASIFLEQGLGGYRFGNYGPPRWVSLDLTYRFH